MDEIPLSVQHWANANGHRSSSQPSHAANAWSINLGGEVNELEVRNVESNVEPRFICLVQVTDLHNVDLGISFPIPLVLAVMLILP